MGTVLLTPTTAILLTAATAFAQMGTGQDGQMMQTERGWGLGWGLAIILFLIVVLGAAYLMKKKEK